MSKLMTIRLRMAGVERPNQLGGCEARSESLPVLQRLIASRAIEKGHLDQDGKPPLRLHDLRHTFASLLIGEGLDVVYVSHRLGHASPSTTLNVYAKLWKQADRDKSAGDAVEAVLPGKTKENAGGGPGQIGKVSPAAKLAHKAALGSGGD
jgi:hypothetical protein